MQHYVLLILRHVLFQDLAKLVLANWEDTVANRCYEIVPFTRAFAVAVLRPGINCRCTYEHGSQSVPSRRH